MATLRVRRIASIVGVTTAPKLRVSRIASITQAAAPTSFTVNASADVTVPSRAYTAVTFSASAPGQTIMSWLWTALTNGPALSSVTAQNPTTRLKPELAAVTHQWRITATNNTGGTGTAVVSVPTKASQYVTADPVTGAWNRPMTWVGHVPGSPVTPPAPSGKLRVRRITAVIDKPAETPPPPPPGTNTTLLVGGRVNLPGSASEASEFATWEAEVGQLQCTKDYFPGGSLPVTYNSPFPSRVLVVYSMARDTNLTNANFTTFVASLPAGTLLTFQHEPERPNFPWNSGGGAGGSAYVALLNDFRAKVRAIRTDCPVWMYSAGYQYRSGNEGYDGSYFVGNKADGYGYDGYRAGTNNTQQGQKVIPLQDRAEFQRWKSFVPPGKPWGATEIGFGRVDNPPDYPEPGLYAGIVQDRIDSTQSTYDWLLANGAVMMLYFFSGEGPDGHNWLPADQAFKDMYSALTRKT